MSDKLIQTIGQQELVLYITSTKLLREIAVDVCTSFSVPPKWKEQHKFFDVLRKTNPQT